MSKTKAVWTVFVIDGHLCRTDDSKTDCIVGDVYSHAAELRRILRRGQAKPKTCVWTLDTGEGVATLACSGQEVVWDDDPRSKAHGIRFCHSCGGAVQWRVKK